MVQDDDTAFSEENKLFKKSGPYVVNLQLQHGPWKSFDDTDAAWIGVLSK